SVTADFSAGGAGGFGVTGGLGAVLPSRRTGSISTRRGRVNVYPSSSPPARQYPPVWIVKSKACKPTALKKEAAFRGRSPERCFFIMEKPPSEHRWTALNFSFPPLKPAAQHRRR